MQLDFACEEVAKAEVRINLKSAMSHLLAMVKAIQEPGVPIYCNNKECLADDKRACTLEYIEHQTPDNIVRALYLSVLLLAGYDGDKILEGL